MARIACPHCAQQLELPENVAGKTIRCPKCQQTFAAPPAEIAVTVNPPPAMNADEGVTEKAPAPRSMSEPLFDDEPRRRRERYAPAKSSSGVLIVVVVACVGVVGLCSCGVIGMLAGLFSFGAAVAQHEAREEAVAQQRDNAVKIEVEADGELARVNEEERRKKRAFEFEEKERADKQKAWNDKFKFEEELKEKQRAEELAKPQHGEFKRLNVANNQDVRTLLFTADGKSLYAATRGESVHSWDLANWNMTTYTLAGVNSKGFGNRDVGAVAFTANGQKVFFGKHGGKFSWYDLTKSPAPQSTMQIGDEPGRGIAFNHIAVNADGSRVCTCHGDNVAYIWDVATRAKLATLKNFNNQVHAAAFHPENDSLAAGAEDIQVFDTKTTTKIAAPAGLPRSFLSLQFSPKAAFLAGVRNNSAYRWDTNDLAKPPTKIDYDQMATRAAYSPDGKTLAVGVHHTRIYFYDAATMKERFILDMRKDRDNWDSPHAIAYHPDGRRFAVARGATIYLFDLVNFDKGK